MKRFASLLIIGVTIVLILLKPAIVDAGGNEVARVKSATEVLTEIMTIPEKSIPPSLLSNAYGVAVIPGVIKVGLGLGGRHGRGILVVRTEGNNWSNPTFISLRAGSIGWQIGVQSTDIILVFKNSRGVDTIREGNFTLGVDASVAAGPVGRHIGASTDMEFKAEIYSYSRSRGLFAGIALEGSDLEIDHNANSAFYGKEDITPENILSNKDIEAPACADKLKQVLAKHTHTQEGTDYE